MHKEAREELRLRFKLMVLEYTNNYKEKKERLLTP